ncbi:MAG: hypothetical protein WCJ58_04175 [bacterium]
MNSWDLHILHVYFQLITNGQKRLDLRVPDPEDPKKAMNQMQPGDLVTFTPVLDYSFRLVPAASSLRCEVEVVNQFNTIEAALQKFDYQQFNPLVESQEEYINTVYSFPGYLERINDAGVVIFQFKLIV